MIALGFPGCSLCQRSWINVYQIMVQWKLLREAWVMISFLQGMVVGFYACFLMDLNNIYLFIIAIMCV